LQAAHGVGGRQISQVGQGVGFSYAGQGVGDGHCFCSQAGHGRCCSQIGHVTVGRATIGCAAAVTGLAGVAPIFDQHVFSSHLVAHRHFFFGRWALAHVRTTRMAIYVWMTLLITSLSRRGESVGIAAFRRYFAASAGSRMNPNEKVHGLHAHPPFAPVVTAHQNNSYLCATQLSVTQYWFSE
jgi:hypothetical protein